MPVTVHCIQCGAAKSVQPYRAGSFKFCSYECRGQWRSVYWRGENHPNWKGGIREKQCAYCGETFQWEGEPYATFENRKFCSKACADKGGFRWSGEQHPNYRADARRRNRGGSHHQWVNAVISRDEATCQRCGIRGVEMHAHHIKPYQTHPELRFEVSNGETLCYRCHWAEHSADNENGVNSGKLLTGGAEDNPEPSPSGNVREGVTTRGRAYRRWESECAYCGAFVSRRWSDVKHSKRVFCNKSCSARFNQNWRNAHGGNASTSAPRESDDIV